MNLRHPTWRSDPRTADRKSAMRPGSFRPETHEETDSRGQGRGGLCCERVGAPSAGSGFTLVEVTLSLSLMVIVLGCAYACLSAGFAAQKVIEPRTDAIQGGRVALALMTADLRCACKLPGDTEFLGMQRRIGEQQADNLDFATHNYSPSRPQEGDFCEMSYFVEPDPQSGQLCLWRRRNPMIGLDPLAGGRRELIVSGIQGLQLEYTDGLDWYDSWGELEGQRKQATSSRYRGNLYGMPEAVRITLLVDADGGRKKQEGADKEPPPPLVFKTVARLNLASASLTSSSSSTSSGSESSTTQGNPAQPNPGGVP